MKEFMCFNCPYTTDSIILGILHTLIPGHKIYESKNRDGKVYERIDTQEYVEI